MARTIPGEATPAVTLEYWTEPEWLLTSDDDTLQEGDEIEIVEPVLGIPHLTAGLHGWVVFTPDDLGAADLCTIRLCKSPGRRVWRVPVRNLRRTDRRG
jgi:hypothetical protein